MLNVKSPCAMIWYRPEKSNCCALARTFFSRLSQSGWCILRLGLRLPSHGDESKAFNGDIAVDFRMVNLNSHPGISFIFSHNDFISRPCPVVAF